MVMVMFVQYVSGKEMAHTSQVPWSKQWNYYFRTTTSECRAEQEVKLEKHGSPCRGCKCSKRLPTAQQIEVGHKSKKWRACPLHQAEKLALDQP